MSLREAAENLAWQSRGSDRPLCSSANRQLTDYSTKSQENSPPIRSLYVGVRELSNSLEIGSQRPHRVLTRVSLLPQSITESAPLSAGWRATGSFLEAGSERDETSENRCETWKTAGSTGLKRKKGRSVCIGPANTFARNDNGHPL